MFSPDVAHLYPIGASPWPVYFIFTWFIFYTLPVFIYQQNQHFVFIFYVKQFLLDRVFMILRKNKFIKKKKIESEKIIHMFYIKYRLATSLQIFSLKNYLWCPPELKWTPKRPDGKMQFYRWVKKS